MFFSVLFCFFADNSSQRVSYERNLPYISDIHHISCVRLGKTQINTPAEVLDAEKSGDDGDDASTQKSVEWKKTQNDTFTLW